MAGALGSGGGGKTKKSLSVPKSALTQKKPHLCSFGGETKVGLVARALFGKSTKHAITDELNKAAKGFIVLNEFHGCAETFRSPFGRNFPICSASFLLFFFFFPPPWFFHALANEATGGQFFSDSCV